MPFAAEREPTLWPKSIYHKSPNSTQRCPRSAHRRPPRRRRRAARPCRPLWLRQNHLLRILAGLETPTTGSVQIGNRDATAIPADRRDRRRPLPATHSLSASECACQSRFRPDLRESFNWFRKDSARDQAVAHAAQMLGLTDLLERRPSELSGGQQQRVALVAPLFADRPFFSSTNRWSNLDLRLRLEMRRELHLLHKRLRRQCSM